MGESRATIVLVAMLLFVPISIQAAGLGEPGGYCQTNTGDVLTACIANGCTDPRFEFGELLAAGEEVIIDNSEGNLANFPCFSLDAACDDPSPTVTARTCCIADGVNLQGLAASNCCSPTGSGETVCGTGAPATCTDDIRNGDETGVDCGGSCPACSLGSLDEVLNDPDECAVAGLASFEVGTLDEAPHGLFTIACWYGTHISGDIADTALRTIDLGRFS